MGEELVWRSIHLRQMLDYHRLRDPDAAQQLLLLDKSTQGEPQTGSIPDIERSRNRKN